MTFQPLRSKRVLFGSVTVFPLSTSSTITTNLLDQLRQQRKLLVSMSIWLRRSPPEPPDPPDPLSNPSSPSIVTLRSSTMQVPPYLSHAIPSPSPFWFFIKGGEVRPDGNLVTGVLIGSNTRTVEHRNRHASSCEKIECCLCWWARPNPVPKAFSPLRCNCGPTIKTERLLFAAESKSVFFVRQCKFSGFLKNHVTLTAWLRSDVSNPYAIYLSTLFSWLALRNVLGRMDRVNLSWSVWICLEKSCDYLSFDEVKIIRPIILSSSNDWLPVLQPRNLLSLRKRVLLNSARKSISHVFVTLGLVLRVMDGHMLAAGVKRANTMSVPLQSSTYNCPVDREVCFVLSVVGNDSVKASGNVNSISNWFSDSDLGSLAIMEEFAIETCSSFNYTLIFMLFNVLWVCLCRVFYVSLRPFLDVNIFSSLECNSLG